MRDHANVEGDSDGIESLIATVWSCHSHTHVVGLDIDITGGGNGHDTIGKSHERRDAASGGVYNSADGCGGSASARAGSDCR